MAFYGWPVAQCQSIDTPLSVQLESGIRVLDIRLALVKDHLIAYHGITHITIMCFVGVAKHHRVLDLSPGYTSGTDSRAFIYLRPHLHRLSMQQTRHHRHHLT